ncbi:hypothetical protein F2Q68_00039722 [Brassica cretica]|uniref:Amine oxidase n=1 Tax=Brassica cretica TaxID=69181 RepID=A0A8S9ME60_BRACR|nr:hypothetical protein F2Q68_00039722 [Brassica cretica]
MAPLHLNIIIFFSFIFATSSSSFAPSRHPFDPLTETELKLIQNIINKTYPISPSHKFTFQYVGLNEPDKVSSLVLVLITETTSNRHHVRSSSSLDNGKSREISVDFSSRAIVSDKIHEGNGYLCSQTTNKRQPQSLCLSSSRTMMRVRQRQRGL